MSIAFVEIFRKAAQLNREDPRRRGNLLELPVKGELIVAGDLHGHRANLAKIMDYADLPGHPQRMLVLQEIIHGPPQGTAFLDRSVEMLLRAARLKLAHPTSVLMLLGNHDIAQVTGNEITKDGMGVCEAFAKGMAHVFGQDAGEVTLAVHEFLLSPPLAIRAGGLFLAHSLPSPERMSLAGVGVLEQHGYGPQDLRRGGAAYEWTWGRNQQPEQLDALAGQLGVDFFILAHRHCEEGYHTIGSRGLYLASDHEHGCILQLPLDAAVSMEYMLQCLKPIVTLGKL